MFSGLLIGSYIKVTESSDRTLKGVSGQVLDETKNTLVVQKGPLRVIVPKAVVSFEVKDSNGRLVIALSGKDLIAAPQDRINKL